jgi:hypothetical protein
MSVSQGSSGLATCERCATPLERGDLRCAVCGLGAPPQQDTERGAELGVQVLRCTGCSAALVYDAERAAPRCAFCDEELELEQVLDLPEEVRAWVPFAVELDAAQAALRRWLGSQGFFRPPDLAARARVEELQPVYFPAWVFDARAEVTWAADSDAGSWRSSWAPHSGTCHLTFDDIPIPASRGLTLAEQRALAQHYQIVDLVREDPPRELSGRALLHEAFDTQRSFARARILSSIRELARDHVERHEVPGSRVRKVGVSMKLEGLETRRVALPAWILTWRYDDRLYRAVVHGVRDDVVHGGLPLSWVRVFLVAASVLFLVLLVVAVVGMAGL